jgi:endonuclease/exonuclease/phosphatase family metal-dependent hydrolase
MRIATWNMNHCMRSTDSQAAAWRYLRDELNVDVALVQEAVPPADTHSVYRPIDERHPRYRWGSAIVALNPKVTLRARPRVALSECYLTPAAGEQVPDSHPGSSAVADIVDGSGAVKLTVVSVYGLWEMMADGKNMDACARLHRTISDLTSVLAASRRSPLVLAGDFNISTQLGKPAYAAAQSAVALERLRTWGLVDCIAHTRSQRPRLANCACLDGAECAHVQTFRANNRTDGTPLQLDYAFVSGALLPRVWRVSRGARRCRVGSERPLSSCRGTHERRRGE